MKERKNKIMYVDLTVNITPEIKRKAEKNDRFALMGHLGTHFDAMGKTFSLDYLRLKAVIFNVTHIRGREITVEDVDLDIVEPKMFVCFCTGNEAEFGYGNVGYFKNHIVLSDELVNKLVEIGVYIIGIDTPGVRPGPAHSAKDQYCADRGTFIVENMGGIEHIVQDKESEKCIINTYPIRFSDIHAILCRVVAEV